jgi:hypothetical protein
MTDTELKKLVASLAVSQAELIEQQKVSQAELIEQRKVSQAELIEQQKVSQAERIEQQKESDAKFDAKLARVSEELKEQQMKTDAKLARVSEELKEQQMKTDAKLAQVSEMVGSMANTRGEIAEEFFYRSLCENPCLGSLCFHYVYRHLGGSVENTHDEYDVVLLNDDALVIVEVKAKAKRNTFQQLVKRKIPNFTLLFPDYKKYGAVASMVSNDKLIGYAKKHGIFLITQKSRHLSLMNEHVTAF